MQTYNTTFVLRSLQTLLLKETQGLEKNSYLPLLAYTVKSNGPSETYGGIGDAPAMEEIKDDIIRHTPFTDWNFTIRNKLWGSSVAVRRIDIEDDQYGAIKMLIGDMVASAQQHKNSLLTSVLLAGTTDLGYDGVAFFSASHPARGQQTAVQSNLISGTGSTTAAVQTDINTVIAKLASYVAENGQPYHESPSEFAIMAPWAMRKQFMEALNLSEYPDRTQAQMGGINIQLVFNSRLTDVNDWYFLHTGNGRKPLIFQDRVPLTFETLDEMSTPGFMREQLFFKCRARYNAGYARWQNAIKVTN